MALITDAHVGYDSDHGGALRNFLSIIRRRLGLILAVALVLTALGAIWILLTPPTYRATAFVESDFTRIIAENGAPQNNTDDEQTIIRTQIETVGTRLVPRVVDLQNLMADPEFNPTLRPSLLPAGWSLKGLGEWLGLSSAEEKTPDEIRNNVIDTVRQKVDAVNDGRSHVIRISFSSSDPDKAARLANVFAQEFIVDQIETKHQAQDEVAQQLSSRLTDLRARLKEAELAAQQFREQQTAILPVGPNGATVASEQLAQMNQQLVQVQVERAQADARLAKVQQILKSGAVPDSASDVLNSPLIQRLKERETELRAREAQLAQVYGPAYPEMQKVRSELKGVQGSIAAEIKNLNTGVSNEVAVAQAKEASLRTRIKALEQTLGTNTRSDLRYQELQRDVDNSRKLYDDFVARLKEVDVQQGLARPTARIIHDAEIPVAPAPPGKTTRIGIVFLSALLIGALAGCARERLDRGARTASEIEEVSGHQALAFVPAVPRIGSLGPEQQVMEDPRGYFADSLQTVRARIQQCTPQGLPMLLVVASSVPEEGKTTFCVSLARLLARSGHRVLLIDADLRRPSVGKLLGDNKSGTMTDVLTGSKTLADVVQTDASGLDFVVAHGSSGDAQNVFSPRTMREIKRLLSDYDLVLFDTPPIGPLPDAGVIAQYSDAALFLVRWGKTPAEVAAGALRRLSDFNANVLGVIFTRVNVRALPKFEQGHQGYYYQHYRTYYSDRSA